MPVPLRIIIDRSRGDAAVSCICDVCDFLGCSQRSWGQRREMAGNDDPFDRTTQGRLMRKLRRPPDDPGTRL